MITFVVPGAPQGKGRPRVGRGSGGHARMFTPAKTVAYESLVAHAAYRAMEGRPLIEGPVSVLLSVLVPVPKSWSRKKAAAALEGKVWPTTKPDLDNVVKAIFDGLNGIVWRDDVQAATLTVSKRYASEPQVQVSLWEAA